MLLGLDDGGFFARSWPAATIALAAAAALAVVVAPGVRLSRLDVAFVGGLAAYAGWQAISAAWSVVPEASLREAQRGLLYVAAALALVAVGRRNGALPLLVGVVVGAGSVAAYSLGRRVVLGPEDVPFQGDVLNAPLGYANALGLLAALALVGALGLVVAVPRLASFVALAVVAPIAVATLGLTASRGSWLAAAAGTLALGVLAVARVTRVRAAVLAAFGLALVAILAAPLVWDLSSLARRLSDRPYYWWTAWHAAADRPLQGWGAGSFAELWDARRPVAVFVQDAHSVFLETLTELGPVGLALVLVALLPPLDVAARAARPAVAAASGAYVTFLVHAGVDWDWELPAVTVAGLACGVALLAEQPDERGARADAWLLPAALAAVALGVVTFVLG